MEVSAFSECFLFLKCYFQNVFSRDLFDMYRPYPKFFFGFHSEMSHDQNLPVQVLDEDLKNFLQVKTSSISS